MRFRRVASSIWPETGARTRPARPQQRGAGSGTAAGGSTRARLVRRYLETYLRGDVEGARRMVTEDFTVQMLGPDGQPVILHGYDAVVAYTAGQGTALGRPVSWELLDVLTSEDQVAVMFEIDPPPAARVDSRQLALWGFRGDRIASCRTFGAPSGEPGPG